MKMTASSIYFQSFPYALDPSTQLIDYADLKKQVDGLDTKNQAKFATGLKDVVAQMKKLDTQGALDAMKNLESGDTKQALSEQAGCKQVSPSPSRPAASRSARAGSCCRTTRHSRSPRPSRCSPNSHRAASTSASAAHPAPTR